MSENMTREEKLETIVKIFAKIMFYGDWKWETPNERVIEMLMREVDLYPFPNEDAMIFSTKVDENLYVEAREKVKGRYTVQTFDEAKEMEKQQQGYSEEEVLELWNWLNDGFIIRKSLPTREELIGWFEQFKNK